MADFTFVRVLTGMTPQAELRTAGGAMEVGDIVIYEDTGVGPLAKVVKAADAATRATMVGLCLGRETGAGDDSAIAEGELVQVLPFTSDMILETALTSLAPGTAVDLNVDGGGVQTAVTTAAAPFARVFKVVDSARSQIRLLAD